MEVERKVLSELRVIDLKRELEKRGLDKNGVKAVLMERLSKALQDEGITVETHIFELDDGKGSIKGEDLDKCGVAEDESVEEPVKEVDVKKEEVKLEPEIEPSVEPSEEKKPLVANVAPVVETSVTNYSQLEQEDEALITLTETEGSLLGNDDEDDRGLQDESEEPIISDQTIQKSQDIAHPVEIKSEVLETVDALDKTEESEPGGEDNAASGTLENPVPDAGETNNIGDNHQQQSETPGDKTKDVKNIGANLWVSNLSPETKATDLKRLFSRHGKLLGAKIVTSARTPGARCYGYVTMANIDDADRCIRFLHRVELHGRLVYVEKAKDDATGPLRNRTRSHDRDAANRRTGNREAERRVSPPRARRRSPNENNVVALAKIKDVRDRQRQRDVERRERATARREYEEELNARGRERRQRLLAERLEKEKARLRVEREKVEREKEELLKMERERQRLERERLEREKEEIRNRKKRLQERPPLPRPTSKRPSSDDKRSDYPSKRQVIDKEEMLLEPPPPPRFSDQERQRDSRSRRDDKRPPPRRDEYRTSSPSRDRYARDKVDRRGGKDDSRSSSRYESKPKSHDNKNWPSNGTQYGGYTREVWSTSRQDWPQTDSSNRWPADPQAQSSRSSYASVVYSGAAYSGHAQPSPPGASVPASHGRYSDPRFDTYAHSLPVRKY